MERNKRVLLDTSPNLFSKSRVELVSGSVFLFSRSPGEFQFFADGV